MNSQVEFYEQQRAFETWIKSNGHRRARSGTPAVLTNMTAAMAMLELIKHVTEVYEPEISCQTERLNFNPMAHRMGGASVNPDAALAATIGEAVERYCAAYYEPEELVFATYKEGESDAVHPSKFGLFSERQYAKPDFPYKPLTTDSPIIWTWGYALQRQKPTLVPASLTYLPFRINQSRRETHLTYTVGESNYGRMVNAGCQAALSPSAAILKSLVEASQGRNGTSVIKVKSTDGPAGRGKAVDLFGSITTDYPYGFAGLHIPLTKSDADVMDVSGFKGLRIRRPRRRSELYGGDDYSGCKGLRRFLLSVQARRRMDDPRHPIHQAQAGGIRRADEMVRQGPEGDPISDSNLWSGHLALRVCRGRRRVLLNIQSSDHSIRAEGL